MKKHVRFGTLVFLLGFLSQHSSMAQDMPQASARTPEPEMYAEAFSLQSDQPGRSRMDVFVQVPYGQISFVKDGDVYAGRIEISATVLNAEKEQVWQKSQLVDLRVKDFSQTVSPRFSTIKQFSTDLPPGMYELVLQATDQESKKNTIVKKSITLKNYSVDTLGLSDVMLAFQVRMEGTQRNVVPNLTGTFDKGQDVFHIFFEVYARIPMDSVQLVCSVLNSKQQPVTQRRMTQPLTGARTQVVWQMDSLTTYSDQYTLTIEAVAAATSAQTKMSRAATTRSFHMRMKNLPFTITDLDKATDQLQYIAKDREIDVIREAKNQEEKLKLFLEFWKKHDPDPKTVNNELMEEYYARIAYVNRTFSDFREGWRTDRGMVLIRFGYPQNVERHPFDSNNKPYEIWYYYDQNREFIFVDESGFGDYQLRYPTTDLWGRVR